MSIRRASPALAIALALLAISSPSPAQKSPEETVAGMKAAPGLEVKLWASEPMSRTRPTWTSIPRAGSGSAEAANYRGSKRAPRATRS